jgi:hypothetical protein
MDEVSRQATPASASGDLDMEGQMETIFRRSAPVLGALTLCVLAVAALAGCGGGSGNANAQTPSSGTPPPMPTISGTPVTQATAGQAYSFTPTASGPSGMTLSFSAQNPPSWATFSTSTGTLGGTPSDADVGTFSNIVISVSDGQASAALPAFSVQVTGQPVRISGTPATQVTAGQAYSFTPTASGPTGATLTFSVQNLPSWATFSTSTGTLSGTPSSSNVGTFANIVISVTDGRKSAALAAFSIQVTATAPPPPPPPTISGTPATQVNAGQAYAFTPTASGPAGMTLAFSVQNLPSWATFSTSTGTVSGTPSSSNVGTFANITISVSDGQASAALPPFSVQVNAVPPTISGTPATQVNEGQAYSFTPTASGPSGLKLTFSVQNLPSWATFSTSTGTVSGTPSSSNVGTFSNIVITVNDGQLSASLAAFSIQVKAVAPTISGTPSTQVTAGQPYSFTPTASGPAGLTLSFSVQSLPGWATFSTSTGTLSGTPPSSYVGTFLNIVISVSDGQMSASLPAFSIQVNAQPPTISGTPSTQVTAGQAYSFTPSASGPAGLTLSFSVQNLPSWATFSTSTGTVSGTPSSSNVGTFANIVITVSDGQASAALPAFSIQVTAQPPPTISGTPPTQVTAGQAYSFTPTASGPAGLTLSFSVQNLPSWATFNTSTGTLSGTPSSSNVGTFSNIVITVSDGPASASLTAFSIQVKAIQPPTISGTPPTQVTAGQAYSFTPTASGPAGTTLGFSVQNMPSWATFSIVTGTLSGTPSSSNVGTFANIVISVSDGQASAALPAFSIQVNAQAGSGSATLSWVAPTTNTDGSPLTDLAGFTINYGTSATNLNQQITVSSATATGYTVTGLTTGSWYFTVTAYTTVGTQSAPSNVASETIS